MIKFNFSKQQEIKNLLWLYGEATFFAKMPYKVYYPDISNDLTKVFEKKPKDNQNILELNK